MRRLLLLAVIASCGPKAAPIDVPLLPGDGTKNVAKPNTPKVVVPDPWAGKQVITAPPAKDPAPVELPAIDSFKLGNGLQVFVVKSDRLPVASIQLAVKAGRMQEPPSRLGVAEIAAEMLVKGTRRRNALALAKAIDFVGGTIAADATFEATLMSCSALSRNLNTCLELVPEMLTQPAFPEAELSRVKQQAIAGIRQRLDDAGALASAHVQNLLWGNDHVRGWITSAESVSTITRDDLVAWHKAWFVPGNAMLVVAGDVDPKRIKGDLERSFGRWQKGPVAPSPQFKEAGLSGSRIRLVDKPGQTQAHIRVAQFGIKHTDPRFFDTLVWNYTLGGGAFSSRLMRVVRVEGGKAYGASSSFDRNLDRGSFVASTFTRNSEAVATTKLILAEIARMAKDGPTKDEVTAAIANLAGGYGLRFQSAADVGASLLTAELHGYGREYLQNYPIAVGKVDVASARKSAAEILDPKAYVVVIVGDAKDLEPQLKAAGWKYQKVAFTDPITPLMKIDLSNDPKALAAGKTAIEEALAAKGGKAKLEAVKGFRMIAAGTTVIGPQQTPVEVDRLYLLPDKMRLDAKLAGGRFAVTITADGKKGWQRAIQDGKTQIVDIPAESVEQIEFERWREPELILLKAADPKLKAWAGPDENVDGKPQTVVRFTSPHKIDFALYLDKRTKLLTRMVFTEGTVPNTDTFSEFKDVKGIKVAHRRHSTGFDAPTQQMRETKLELKTVEFDPKYDPKVFDKPAS